MSSQTLGRSLFAVGIAVAISGCLGTYPDMTGTGDGGTGAGTGKGGGKGGGTGTGTDGGTSTAPESMVLCEAEFTLSGTYTQGSAPPADFQGGCWPDGVWTFTATVTTNNCPNAPVLEGSYSFKVVEDLDYNDTVTYLNHPNDTSVATKINGGDGGICSGAFLVYSADGKTVVNLRPAMQAGNVINGAGDYRIYNVDQR